MSALSGNADNCGGDVTTDRDRPLPDPKDKDEHAFKGHPPAAPSTSSPSTAPSLPSPLLHVQALAAAVVSGPKRRVPEWNPDAYHDPKRHVPMPSAENSWLDAPQTSGAASDLTIPQSVGFGKTQKGKGLLNEVKNACKISESRPVVSHNTFGVGLEFIHSDTTSNVGALSESHESSPDELGEVQRVVDSVVSLTSVYGPVVMCECTGVLIEVEGLYAHATCILTSASLFRFSDMICDNMMIKVRLPGDKFGSGQLLFCDLDSDLAVVAIRRVHHLKAVNLSSSHGTQLESHIKAVAFRHCFDSGSLIPSDDIVIQTGVSRLTHEISNDWIGGPLVDSKGTFAGMICSSAEGTTFLPKNKIVDWLKLDKPIRRNTASTVYKLPSEWHEMVDETQMFAQDDPYLMREDD